MATRPNRFQATIYEAWILSYVDMPKGISRMLAGQMVSGVRSCAGRKRTHASVAFFVSRGVSGSAARLTVASAFPILDVLSCTSPYRIPNRRKAG